MKQACHKIGFASLCVIAAASSFVPAPICAEGVLQPPVTYLSSPDIGYTPPPAPDNDSDVGKADLRAVISAQPQTYAARQEAFEDAAAYNYDDLLPRFSVAAGTSLELHTRPILAHMLKVALLDVTQLVRAAKHAKARERPYKEDGNIIPCETDYLPPTENESYPSGHATNGYTAALLLSSLMPERKALLMARGIRYGDNRVVCGVHHPTDVEAGRAIASAYFKTASANGQFQTDFACALEEHQSSIAIRTGERGRYSPSCGLLARRYAVEAEAQVAISRSQLRSFIPQ